MSKSKKVVVKAVKLSKSEVIISEIAKTQAIVTPNAAHIQSALQSLGHYYANETKWVGGARRIHGLMKQLVSIEDAWMEITAKRSAQADKVAARREATKQRKIARLQAQLDKLQA